MNTSASMRDDALPRSPRRLLRYELAKRCIDVTVAVAALAMLSPFWFIVMAAIRLTSDGPALFRTTVVGQHGRRFTYFKFRTMIAGNDSHHREWLRQFVENDAPYAGRDYKVRDDPRVTALGRILRRSSLDEVPQLLNVITGDMSLVGPRPPIEFECDLYDDNAKRRLTVKPGITGLYQVSARSQVPFSGMLALDLDYVSRRSCRLDLFIMLKTVKVIVTGRGAG
jgi:lipopolysaccharide/colanic/teichoic acid biosynthesis glycosyltransferase